MITTEEIIKLLVEHVADISSSGLVKKCEDIGMIQVPYQDIGLASNLPTFEKGYHFRFSSDGNNDAIFEILEKDDYVLQAGFQFTTHASLFFSKASKNHRQLKDILESHYGIGQPMHVSGFEIINYSNHSTIAYISKAKVAAIDSITVRVGNRKFWG